jgi:hypothetical protein
MFRSSVGTLAFAAGLSGVLMSTAFAQTPAAFTLGFPWTKNSSDAPAAPDSTRKQTQWHIAGASDTFTMVDDSTASYADALAAIQKNFSDNHVKPSVNKDFTCAGKMGHIVEFTAGPDGHQVVINRVLLPETPTAGLLTFTYLRTDKDWDDSVLKSMKAYCGVSPI